MIVRQLKKYEYEGLLRDLMQKAYAEPLEAFYTVLTRMEGSEYAVRLQPEGNNQVAVLQAYEIERDEDGPTYLLITQEKTLAALLTLLVDQGI